MTTNTDGRESQGQREATPRATQPTQFTIFKGKAAARFAIEKPKENYKVGCLYLQAAPSKGEGGDNNTYDWENKKISVKFGINDISTIYHNLKNGDNVELFHDFNDKQKIVKFTTKEGGGYFLSIQEVDKGTKAKNFVSVPISPEETSTLTTLVFWSIPLVHNWM